ncbi:TetR family transcriptional regulator [Subtercola boreus]|uniref:TetR family transcriptional regulator n=1 Tax=Subtercola boreus TaxID=120213 RepID=A0A3E0VTQ6_9MICO|nr:TetR family transcriptional regulator [Subtercola boreus]RFA13121.1 TetR family transcriptional regulator [Subtercola boreus]
MIRDSERTKKLLLDAATSEFAASGIAGARVDRIAAIAGVNKSMIYSYFGSKDDLFDIAFSIMVRGALEEVLFDVTDLPGYAGRLLDSFEDNPDMVRLTTWYQLERPHGVPLQAVEASNQSKLEKLRDAIDAGVLPARLEPVEILALVRAAALSWFTTVPELDSVLPKSRERRRAVVVEAVRRMVALN